jgi:hypothetical protein
MAGMGGLGREFDVITLASGVYFSMKNASGVSLVCKCSSTTTTSVALVAATTYSAGTTANWTTANGFGQTSYYYQNTSDTGTAAWTKQTATWTTNSVAIGATSGYVSVLEIFTSQFADTYCYLEATGTNCTIVAVLHDLTVQRNPANLAILGA